VEGGEAYAQVAEEADQAFAGALEAFSKVLSVAPNDTYAHINQGNALVSRGDLLVHRALDDRRMKSGQAYKAAYEAAQQHYAGAVAAYDEALRLAPNDTSAQTNKGTALTHHANLLVWLARWVEDREVYALLSEAAQEYYEAAVEAYDEVLRLAPDAIGVHYNEAEALLKWGLCMQSVVPYEVTRTRWQAARGHAEYVLTLAPQHEPAQRLIARVGRLLNTLTAEPDESH